MFDIGWQELFIVAILGLIVVGPKDLPRALRTVMGLVRKARMMARDFQDGIDDVVREADLDDMKKRIEEISDKDIGEKIQDAIDPTGGIADDLGMSEIQQELDTAVKESLDVNEADKTDKTEPAPKGPSRSVGESAKTPEALPDTTADKDA